MLSEKVFLNKMFLLGTYSYGDMYKSVEDVKILYPFFKDYPDEAFSIGIDNLLRKEESGYAPSIGKIIKYIEEVLYMGMSKEEFSSVIRVYQATGGEKYSNPQLNKILKEIDIQKTLKSIKKNGQIIYKGEDI